MDSADFDALEAQARGKLSPAAYAFAAAGADDEVTLADNIAAWRRLRLRPRVLNDITAIDTSVSVLGARLADADHGGAVRTPHAVPSRRRARHRARRRRGRRGLRAADHRDGEHGGRRARRRRRAALVPALSAARPHAGREPDRPRRCRGLSAPSCSRSTSRSTARARARRARRWRPRPTSATPICRARRLRRTPTSPATPAPSRGPPPGAISNGWSAARRSRCW